MIRNAIICTLALAATLGLSACATPEIARNSQPQPAFVLKDYFKGRSYAYGVVEDGSGKITRSFTVVADGTIKGETLVLDEAFLWNDGTRQQRVWTFVQKAPGEYVGTAADVRGEARLENTGNALRIRYALEVPFNGQTITVDVDDWSHHVADGVVINRADLRKFGFKVGRVTLVFFRPGDARPVAESLRP